MSTTISRLNRGCKVTAENIEKIFGFLCNPRYFTVSFNNEGDYFYEKTRKALLLSFLHCCKESGVNFSFNKLYELAGAVNINYEAVVSNYSEANLNYKTFTIAPTATQNNIICLLQSDIEKFEGLTINDICETTEVLRLNKEAKTFKAVTINDVQRFERVKYKYSSEWNGGSIITTDDALHIITTIETKGGLTVFNPTVEIRKDRIEVVFEALTGFRLPNEIVVAITHISDETDIVPNGNEV